MTDWSVGGGGEVEKDTKTCLIESAEKLISQQGYYNTKIEDITKNAGVAKGTFYTYFKTKEDIIVAIIEYRGIGYMDNIKSILSEDIDFKKKFLKITHYHLSFGMSNKDFFSVTFKAMENGDEALSKVLRMKHIENRRDVLDYIADLIKCGIESGEIDKSFESRILEIANLYEAMRNHHIFFMIMKDRDEINDEKCFEIKTDNIDVQKEAQFITNIFLNGIKNHGGE